MAYGVTYADADAEYSDADAVIFGVPYDHTASFKAGAREAPTAVRQASYNFEEFHFAHGLDQVQPVVCDYGNCDDFILPEDMLEEVKFAVGPTIRDGKFPIVIGGEHSGTIPVIQSFKERSIALMTIDAHLDSRDEYMGTPNSHACVTRRAAEVHGLDNVCAVGVRAIGREELERDDVVPHVTAFDIFEHGIEWGVKNALDGLKADKVYLSIDIDGIDPAYAPGTGTPEPFGLLPIQVKKAINMVGDRLAGFDVMEICPPADHSGITAILGARLINEALAVLGKNLRQ